MDALIHYFRQGGLLMWPLLALSILSWAIILERALRLRRARVLDERLVGEFCRRLDGGDLAATATALRQERVLLGPIVADGIDEHLASRTDIDAAMQGAAERRLHALWDNMLSLNTIARVSTMIGLFGTVVGMVKGFEELSQSGVAKEKLAQAIGIALITTVGGLSVAIPAVIAESAFRSRIRALLLDTEMALVRIVRAVRAAGAADRRA